METLFPSISIPGEATTAHILNAEAGLDGLYAARFVRTGIIRIELGAQGVVALAEVVGIEGVFRGGRGGHRFHIHHSALLIKECKDHLFQGRSASAAAQLGLHAYGVLATVHTVALPRVGKAHIWIVADGGYAGLHIAVGHRNGVALGVDVAGGQLVYA